MKKFLFTAGGLFLCCIFISWGVTGHKTVAAIAANHLTEKSQRAVKALLGADELTDVAVWADRVLKEPEYANTAPRHYVNIKLGLSYDDFSNEILSQKRDNVYNALQNCKKQLLDSTTTKEQKAIALKFIVHFVGDLHQPMHISRAEDLGGNTIHLLYEGNETNLHALWDSNLIATEGKSFGQMAIDYDKATPDEIKQWQSDDVMKWLWESYQISSRLYPEIGTNYRVTNAYYKKYIPVVHQRVEMAGIRLAGLLNEIFASSTY